MFSVLESSEIGPSSGSTPGKFNNLWHSCLLEFLPAHSTVKSWRLNALQRPTSCLRELHKGFNKNAGVSKRWETKNINWSGRRDLNSGPPAPKAGALPGCATPRQLLAIDSTAHLNFLSIDLEPTVHELCKLAWILGHCAQS